MSNQNNSANTYSVGSSADKIEKYQMVQPTTKRQPARFRGPLSSQDYNDFQDSIVHDITNISTAVNTNANKIVNALFQMSSENAYLKRKIEVLEQEVNYRQFNNAINGDKTSQYFDLHNSSIIYNSTSVNFANTASYAARFGEFSLPSNGTENKFYNISLRNGIVVIPSDLVVEVTNNFDKLDGQGAKNYEHNGTVNTNSPLNAFNGMNDNAWVRTVTFPITSNIQEVECQLTVAVPAGISPIANLTEIVSFPEGSVDILEISTASDLGEAFTNVDNFTEQINLKSKRFHFSPRSVEQVRLKLRSKNWSEINGKKVFTYGLQELGLKLIDYSKTHEKGANFGKNITGIIKLNAPGGQKYRTLYRIDSDPGFLDDTSQESHVKLVLSSTPNFIGSVWNSSIHSLPQNQGSGGINISPTEVLYGIFELNFVDNTSGLDTPFLNGTTPWVNGLGLTFQS